MSRKTRILTLSSLFAAISFVTLYFSSVWPTGRFGLAAFSSLFTVAAVIEAGLSPGLYIYVICSALGVLLLPDKSAPLLYALFFGYYPVIKSLIERIRPTALQWILKLFVFNAALTIIWFFLRSLVFGFGGQVPGALLIYAGCNIIFVLFDYGLSKAIGYYITNVSRIRKRTRNRD